MSTIQEINSQNTITFNGVVFNKDEMTSREIERLELEIAVSEFAKQGNKITVLAQGETSYPDGKLPPIQNQKARKEAPPIDPKKTKHVAEDAKRQETIKKAAARSVKLPPTPPKISKPKRVVNHLPPQELERRKKVKEAHCEATLKGLKEFEAPCAKHGLTTFSNYSESCKCKKCVSERREKYKIQEPQDPTRAERSKIISQRRKEAEAKGLKEFQGVCRIHKETLFKIQVNGSRCHQCCLERSFNDRNARRTPEGILDAQRKAANKLLIQKAVEDGVYEFMADCKNCGMTMFRLKPSKNTTNPNVRYAFCIKCTRKQHRKK